MLGPNDTALLAELSKLPPLAPFALLTKLDEEAGAAFVWRPGNRAPSAITGGPLGSTVQKEVATELRCVRREKSSPYADRWRSVLEHH